MTDSSPSKKVFSQASIKNAITLGLFALISTGLIGITYWFTKDKINQEIEIALAKQLNQLIPADHYDNSPYNDCIQVNEQKLLGGKDLKIFRIRKNQKDYALFMNIVVPDGYSGKIKLLLALYSDGSIAGVRVIEHQETPGLGDKIEKKKSDWVDQFIGKSLRNTPTKSWHVVKDGGQFDSLTGATITSRAVTKSLHKSLQYYQKNNSSLFTQAASCGDKNELD